MAYVKFQKDKVKVHVASDRLIERTVVGEICMKIPYRNPFLPKLI